MIVHQNFCCPPCVPCKDVSASTRESVWMLLSEDMTNTTAENNFKLSATLPDPERNNYIFPSLKIHRTIIFSYLVKIILVNHKQSPCNHRCLDYFCGIHLLLLSFPIRQIFPLEHQIPIKASSKISTSTNILKIVHAYNQTCRKFKSFHNKNLDFQKFLQQCVT